MHPVNVKGITHIPEALLVFTDMTLESPSSAGLILLIDDGDWNILETLFQHISKKEQTSKGDRTYHLFPMPRY